MPTIPELAPDLIAAGLTVRELRRELRPREAAPAVAPPQVSAKRWKMTYKMVLKGRPDEEILRMACVPQSVLDAVKAQVAAVRTKLAGLATVAYDAPEVPQPGDPDYVEPQPDPPPVVEPPPEEPVEPTP